MAKTAEKWGAGDPKHWRPVRTGSMGDRADARGVLEIFHGEHPHSRADNNLYAKASDGEVYAFNGHMQHVRVELETYNYLKSSSLSGEEIRKAGKVRIYFDDRIVYGFEFRDPLDALLRTHSVLQKLQEFPVDWKRELQEGSKELVGRPIYYRDTPCTITDWDPEFGFVMIQPTPGHYVPIPAYYDDNVDWNGSRIKEDLMSRHIWWFRKDD